MFLQKRKPQSSNPPSRFLLVFGVLTLFVFNSASARPQKYSDWVTPINLGPVINTSVSEQQPAISKDGLSLYFTSNRAGGFGGFDMYVSQRATIDDSWGSPVNLGSTVNTSANEGNPAFSRNGHLMFFQSDRLGGLGGVDLWVSTRTANHDDFDWRTPVNLGVGVNSSAGENAPSYFENDDAGAPQLYFASSRAGGLGGLDIFMSEQTNDGSFASAVQITELNSTGGDSRPTIRHDGLEIIFQSDRPGTTGGPDLWFATRQSTLDPWSPPLSLGTLVNTTFTDNNPYLSSDSTTLYFISDRPDGFGAQDLYVTTRTKRRGH